MNTEHTDRDSAIAGTERKKARKSTRDNARDLCAYLVSDYDERWYFAPIVLSRADLALKIGISTRRLDRAIDWLASNQILLKRERYSRFPIFRLEANPDAIREFFERSK